MLSHKRLTHKAVLAACLALPLAGFAAVAHAGTTPQERIIRLPAGSVVLVLPSAAVAVPMQAVQMPPVPADFPVVHLMAEQTAMVRNMIRQMQVLDRLTMPMPNPMQFTQAAMDGMRMPSMAPGTSVVTTMVSDGQGVCRQTITYRTTAHGIQAQPHIMQTGDACGPLDMTGPVGVTQTLPMPQQAQPHIAPPPAPRRPPLWTVSYRAHRMAAGAPQT